MRWFIGDKSFDAMAGWIGDLIGLTPVTLAHLLDTLITIVGYLLLRKLLKFAILRRVTEPSRQYGISKTISYVLGLIALLIIAKIWLKADISLATYLGILSAGLAIALQDPIANLAGWLFIVIRFDSLSWSLRKLRTMPNRNHPNSLASNSVEEPVRANNDLTMR